VYPFARETSDVTSLTRIRSKYWPPVRRVDNAFGDRNLVCSCPPPEAFAGV
jgi:glycine dehydrogenase